MRRRTLLVAVSAALVGAQVIPLRRLAQAGSSSASVELMRENWQSLVPADSSIATSLEPLDRTRPEWQGLLDERAYQVLFEAGTEPPFSSSLNAEKRPGVYVCTACNLPLFTSAMKYDSGTGWPSFITHIPGHLATKLDFKLVWPRTEYHCVKCGGHQGHVFDDGPPPSGERWCNNGVALRFIAADRA